MSKVLVSGFLRKVLLADAVVSGAAGMSMLMGAAVWPALLGLPPELLIEAGVGLLPYAAVLLWLARHAQLARAVVWLLLAGNVVWAAGCVALAVGPWFEPNLLGRVFLGLQAVAVVVFAELYFMAQRRGARTAQAALA